MSRELLLTIRIPVVFINLQQVLAGIVKFLMMNIDR